MPEPAVTRRHRPATWLGLWLASRLVLGGVVVGTALVRGADPAGRRADPASWLLVRFAHWDSDLYAAVAVRGYVGHGPASSYNAFFPGLPAVMRAWTAVTGTDGRFGGLLLVIVAGAVAAVALGVLAAEVSGRPEVGTWAVALLATSPLTVFLSVVYTEAVFLALSVTAWLAARRERWLLAGVLTGVAAAFRINGLFLAGGLLALFAVRARRTGVWLHPGALALLIAPVFLVLWAAYLHHLTGSWHAWTSAQEQGWGRTVAWPWTGLEHWWTTLSASYSWHLRLSRLLDLAGFLVALAAPVYYAIRRNWPVVVLLGLNAVPVLFSSMLNSAGRYILVWFPLVITAAACLADRPRWRAAVLVASGALAVLLGYYWANQYWVA